LCTHGLESARLNQLKLKTMDTLLLTLHKNYPYKTRITLQVKEEENEGMVTWHGLLKLYSTK